MQVPIFGSNYRFSNETEVIAIDFVHLQCTVFFHIVVYCSVCEMCFVQILNITCVQSSILLILLGPSVPTALGMSASVSKVTFSLCTMLQFIISV